MSEDKENSSGRSSDSFGKPDPLARDDLRRYVKPGLWSLLGIYVVLFVLKNKEDVNIDFVFFSALVPLIWILLGLLVVGGLLTIGGQWLLRRRRGRRDDTT